MLLSENYFMYLLCIILKIIEMRTLKFCEIFKCQMCTQRVCEQLVVVFKNDARRKTDHHQAARLRCDEIFFRAGRKRNFQAVEFNMFLFTCFFFVCSSL